MTYPIYYSMGRRETGTVPHDHQTVPTGYQNMVYVEVFGGGGSVLLNKERSVREVLNDANGNLINLYRVVREHPDELKDHLLYVLHSRRTSKSPSDGWPNSPIKTISCGQRISTKSSAKATLATASSSVLWPGACGPGSRLSTESQAGCKESPWRKQISRHLQRYDSPTTVFYIDPPYFFTEDYYPGNIFLRSDHQRLAAILLNAEGLWLLSYNLCPEVLELYQQPGILIEQVDRINNMAQRYEGGPSIRKCLSPTTTPESLPRHNCISLSLRRRKGKILWNGLY